MSANGIDYMQPDFILPVRCSSFYFPKQPKACSKSNESSVLSDLRSQNGESSGNKRKRTSNSETTSKQPKRSYTSNEDKKLSNEQLKVILTLFSTQLHQRQNQNYETNLKKLIYHIKEKNSLDQKTTEIGDIFLSKADEFIKHFMYKRGALPFWKNATKFLYLLAETGGDEKYLQPLPSFIKSWENKERKDPCLYKMRAKINQFKGKPVYAKYCIEKAIELDSEDEKLEQLREQIIAAKPDWIYSIANPRFYNY